MNEPAAFAVASASLGRRLGSLCYDLLLLTAIVFVAGWIFLVFQFLLPAALARPVFQLYLLVVTSAYFVYCWTHGGQTLPMKTWRIRVVTRDGGPLHIKRAARRFLCALISTALGGIGFIWALVDRDRQFLHDRLAGTRLIRIAD